MAHIFLVGDDISRRISLANLHLFRFHFFFLASSSFDASCLGIGGVCCYRCHRCWISAPDLVCPNIVECENDCCDRTQFMPNRTKLTKWEKKSLSTSDRPAKNAKNNFTYQAKSEIWTRDVRSSDEWAQKKLLVSFGRDCSAWSVTEYCSVICYVQLTIGHNRPTKRGSKKLNGRKRANRSEW